MKIKTLILTILVLSTSLLQAQFYKSLVPSPEFQNALEKIVLDFRYNYKTIQGESVGKEGGTETFQSTIKLPRAKECTIYQFSSLTDTTASWQALMYSGEDYNEAVKTYENLFKLIKKSRVKWIDKTLVGFVGVMEKPKAEVGFTVSTLRFDLDDPRYRNFLAEVEITPSTNGWEVHLNLNSKKPDSEG
jgi:hypothetical protein